MAKRIPSPDDDDYTRIAEALNSLDVERDIKSRKDYDDAYDNYFEGQSRWQTDKDRQNEVFNKFKPLNLFFKAGGKDLGQDQLTNSKNIVDTEKEYLKLGSQRSDLRGLDTKPLSHKFSFPRQIKGQVVFTRKTIHSSKGRQVTRFRDRRGRFTSN